MPNDPIEAPAPATPAQLAEMDQPADEAFSADDLSAAERAEAERLAHAASAALLKGLLHRIDPAEYPLAGDADEPAVQAAAVASGLSERTLHHLAPRLQALQRRPEALRGILSGADVSFAAFKRPSLREAVPALQIARRPISLARVPDAPERARLKRQTPRNATNYRRAILELRAIHCVRETQPAGWDSIVFGGVLIGASGNAKAIRAFDAGDFRTGHYAGFGSHYLGDYSLRTTDGYPKHLYAIFKLVESDSDDAEVAQELTQAISFVASTIVTAFATAAAGAAVQAILSTLGGFISGLIDEDELRPYGIRLTMEHANPFGGAVGPKKATGNITGHGGAYRVGYRWLLGA